MQTLERDSTARRRLPGLERVLIGLELFLAAGAFFGAAGLIAASEELFDAELVANLPFASPVFAGLALGLFNGVFPMLVAIAALRRSRWAHLGHAAVGVVLVGWIVVQVALIGGWHWLQVTYLGFGLLIGALGIRLLTVTKQRIP